MDGDLGKATDILKQLLSDENAQEKLMSLLGGVLGSNEEPDDENAIIDAETFDETVDDSDSALPALLNGIDIQSLYKNLAGKDDNRVRLLSALKPYLNERRRPKIDNAITMVQMASISSTLGLTKMFKLK